MMIATSSGGMLMSLPWKSLLAAATLASLPTMTNADCRATSAAQTVALIELYTSEGCSSCPPADRWLSRIHALPESAVALSLHVDYWDRLGWKDRFASAEFTARQYEQMRRQGTEYVYTPQVLVQGRDFRRWGTGSEATAIAAINARPARAVIELAAIPNGDKSSIDVHVSVPNIRDRAHAKVAVGIVQDGLVSNVKAGENAGERLAHDHVVRQWRAGLPLDAGGELRERLVFSLPTETGPVSIVAFAENSMTGDILQVLALPMCKSN
jgi:hypothetical protein